MQKFKTSYMLWIVLTLPLFILACFIPRLVTEEGNVFTAARELVGYHFYRQAALMVLSVGSAAVVIGWVLEASLVLWGNRKKIDRDVA